MVVIVATVLIGSGVPIDAGLATTGVGAGPIGVELPRFCGHLILLGGGGICNAEIETAVYGTSSKAGSRGLAETAGARSAPSTTPPEKA